MVKIPTEWVLDSHNFHLDRIDVTKEPIVVEEGKKKVIFNVF